jgi:hypothetical protein
MESPYLIGQEGRGLSPVLWQNFPVDHIFGPEKMAYGVGLMDDFNGFGPCGAISTVTAWFVSNGIAYLGYIDSDAGVMATPGINVTVPSTTPSVDANGPGAIILTPDNDDNDSVSIMAGGGVMTPFNPIYTAAKDLIFETRFKISSIAGGSDTFIGLGGTGACANNGCRADDSGVLASNNFLGFTLLATGTSSLTFTYQRVGGTEATHTGMHTLVADTYLKAGFRFHQDTKMCSVWINGEKVHAVTAAEVAATPWPTLWMNFLAEVKYQSTAQGLSIDWWAAAQLI